MSAVATELAEELSTVRRPGGFFTFSTAEILAPRLIDGAGVIGLWSCLSLCRFSAAGMMAYPHAETAGGRKAPRHEIAGVEAGTGLRGYGDLSVGSILGVVDAVARATRFAGSVVCRLRGSGAAGVLRDEIMYF